MSLFQSTHPVRGATTMGEQPMEEDLISIHAPREGCDAKEGGQKCGRIGFQSTHPVRGATFLNPFSSSK